jgi:16S rRNA (adenine1518-N6/adenine1519-N6)-dimethyltransferase
MSEVQPAHQTLRFLQKRFAEAGIHVKHRHGQNFLIDLNLQRLIVASAGLTPNDVVLEVGTGTGALTAQIAPQVAAVVTVEIDPQLYQLASEELFGLENVMMLHLDALKNKSTFDPRVLEAIPHAMSAGPGRQLKLVANLPYNVGTPVISNLLSAPIVPVSMTVTIQKELADRIAARPGTKDYSALSIWIQSQARVELVRVLAPSVFWPRPKVNSAIIHIEVDREKRGRITDLRFFHDFVRALFFHRRKFFRRQLQTAVGDRLNSDQVDMIIARFGFPPDTRAEQLPVETIQEVAEAVRKQTQGATDVGQASA